MMDIGRLDATSSPIPPATTKHIVLVSEWFPPVVGGSGELLANIYSRISTAQVDVITGGGGSEGLAGSDLSPLRVFSSRFGASAGLFSLEALRNQAEIARAIRRRATPGAIIHCGRALPEGSAAWFSRLLGGSRFACWTHGEELSYAAQSRDLSWLLRHVHRSSLALFANSHNTARLLVELGNPDEKVHVVHPGVDAQRFSPERRDDQLRAALLGDADLLLLSVGRLQKRKGHDLVLQAMSRLARGGLKLRYVIAGHGPEAEALRTMTRDLGLDDQVRFLGEISSVELPSYYAAADIFVHPNRIFGTEFEGFGLVFLEAAASGVPAIGGRSGGVPEAVEEGVTGFLVTGEDSLELEERIRLLAGSANLRTKLGRAARTRVLTEFTWERAAKQVEAVDASLRSRWPAKRKTDNLSV
jgi:phosphatidylinositol alpha-1,6-mannosyltransferase